MPRAIYQKAIYRRPKQLTRKVYQRANNVIPVDSGKYVVTSVTKTAGGKGYEVEDLLRINGNDGDTPATITVLTVAPTKYEVATATAGGTTTGYLTGETVTILGEDGDTSAVLTITAEDGAITALTVTTPGEYAEDIAGEISTYEYTGTGTGLELSVTTNTTADSGAVLTFEFTEGLYNTNLSGSKTLDSITGTGATFTVTMTPQIIGDDEDINQTNDTTLDDDVLSLLG